MRIGIPLEVLPFFLSGLSLAALDGARAADAPAPAPGAIEIPFRDGDWWRIADDDPDVSPYRIAEDGKSNACDFTIFRDARGAWHLVACIRGTTAPGQRVFHQWTAASIEDRDWTPAGLFEAPRGLRTGAPTSQQAPHAFPADGRYYLFYNSGGAARALVSDDGARWRADDGRWHVLRDGDGKEELFGMGRDVCLFRDEARNRWMAFYCGNAPGLKQGVMAARTAPALAGPWSADPIVVRGEGNPESPFVLRHAGRYYLWQQMEVFISDTPERFGGEPVQHMTGIWSSGRWAPEVIADGDRWYLAGYGDGIWLCRIKWVPRTPEQIEEWRRTEYARILGERAAAREREKARERAGAGE
jgi:hypothetical protein